MNRRSEAEILATMALALSSMGMDPALAVPAKKLLDDAQSADEKKFLSCVSGERFRIWSRRISRGLTEDELRFIRAALENETKGE